MNYKNKLFNILIIIMIIISIGIGVGTRFSYTGEMFLGDFLDKNQDTIIVDLETDKEYVNIYFDNNIEDLNELEKNSALIVKVKVHPERKMFLHGIRTKVIIEDVYKSKDINKKDEIYIIEPSSMDNVNHGYTSLGGYNLMEYDKEYILFLKPLEVPKGYKYKGKEKNTFIPISTLYSKYSLEKNENKIFTEEEFIEQKVKYEDVKNYDILSISQKTLDSYYNIKDEVLKKYINKDF